MAKGLRKGKSRAGGEARKRTKEAARRRKAALLAMTRKFTPQERAELMFDAIGMLPHGRPLFADGETTLCARCDGLFRYADLADGQCVNCRRITPERELADAIHLLARLLARRARGEEGLRR